jgi:hypothetical protein
VVDAETGELFVEQGRVLVGHLPDAGHPGRGLVGLLPPGGAPSQPGHRASSADKRRGREQPLHGSPVLPSLEVNHPRGTEDALCGIGEPCTVEDAARRRRPGRQALDRWAPCYKTTSASAAIRSCR